MKLVYLHKNIAGNEQWLSSFLGQLIENNIWDKDEFWCLHSEITKYSLEASGQECIPRDIAGNISRIIQLVMKLYAAHRDPNDICTIQNITDDELYGFIERIECLSITFFTGEVFDEEAFDVQNPYLLNA